MIFSKTFQHVNISSRVAHINYNIKQDLMNLANCIFIRFFRRTFLFEDVIKKYLVSK